MIIVTNRSFNEFSRNPPTIVLPATSLKMNAPAATIAFSPTVTAGNMVAAAIYADKSSEVGVEG